MQQEEYTSFVFYGSWVNLLLGFERDTAKELLWQIMRAGVGLGMETDNPMICGIIQGTILPNIKCAQNRYCEAIVNGNKGGRPRIEIPIDEVMQLRSKGQTIKAIAQYFGCSEDTISRRIHEYEETAKSSKTQNLDKEKEKKLETKNDERSISVPSFGTCVPNEVAAYRRNPSPFYVSTHDEI